jgi:RNA polymerase sigma-70 factor (ECF subfamily)
VRSTPSTLFESSRPRLLALAHQLLEDPDRADDVVQEAWLRYELGAIGAGASQADLIKLVARLCRIDGGARPSVPACPFKAALLDQVSMALLCLLRRLTPQERAVLLLHDVFDLDHGRVAGLLESTEPDCRRLHARAQETVAVSRQALMTSREERRELLRLLVQIAGRGDVAGLRGLLAGDVALIARFHDEPRVLDGPDRIAALLAALMRERPAIAVSHRECELDREPAVVVLRNDEVFAAVLVSVADAAIRQVFVYADARSRGTSRPNR